MAGLDGALVPPDVPVFPQVVAGRLGLLRPSRGAADIRQDAVSLLDADLDVVRRVCPDTVDAILEDHRGRPVHLDEAAEKLAGREPRPADAVLAHLAPAWTACLGLPASAADFVERWARPLAAAALYIQDEAPFAA
jgi:hypothetical protein